MVKRVSRAIAALVFAVGLVVAVDAAPAQAVVSAQVASVQLSGCVTVFVPSIGNATLNTSQGPLPMTYSANYIVPNTSCTGVKVTNLLFADCPGTRQGAFGQVRANPPSGAVTILTFVKCGQSTPVTLTGSIANGSIIRLEFTDAPGAVQSNVKMTF